MSEVEEVGALLIYETIISTQTAVVTPPDLISEWSDAGHRGKSFWDDCQGPWRALKMFEVKHADIPQLKMSLRMG